jgi:hypothetical protein
VKGIVFTLLEETIVDEHGMDAWDRILEEAGLDGVYTTLGNYPYEQLVTLLQAAEPVVGYSGRRAQQWFGRRALHRLADRYPELFEPHTSTREFALTLNDVIHPEVRKLYPGAEVPTFALDEDPEDGNLSLRYESERGLCSFAEGLLLGTGDRYGEEIGVQQPRCVHEGDSYCDLVLTVEASTSREAHARG